MIPLRNTEHTRQILEILEFYPLHGVTMCADTGQAFKTDHFASPDFPILLGDHLANHHSPCKTFLIDKVGLMIDISLHFGRESLLRWQV